MKRIMTLSMVALFAFTLASQAAVDTEARETLDAIRNAKNNSRQIRNLRVREDATIGDSLTVNTNVSVGGDAVISGKSTSATFGMTSVNGPKALQYSKFSYTQANFTNGQNWIACSIPDNAIVVDGFLHLDTVISSTNVSATLSVGIGVVDNLLAATPYIPTNGVWVAGANIHFIPTPGTSSTYLKMTQTVANILFNTAEGGKATGTVSGTGYVVYMQGD